LEDGREIIGLMKGEGGGQDLVRIPKMTGPDWIAESWRKEKKVENLADDDDNEKVAGQKDTATASRSTRNTRLGGERKAHRRRSEEKGFIRAQ